MNVSITGANGFIGSHLADQLLARGSKVRALVRPTSNLRWLKGKDIQLIDDQGGSDDAYKAFVEGADYVYHIAGVVKARTEEEYHRGNVVLTQRVLEAARRHAPSLKRFLFVSSQTVAGPSESLERPVTEDMECHPITRYGKSKREAEAFVAAAADMPWTIVRPCAVYGPRDTEIFIYFQAAQRGLNSMMGFDDKRVSLIHGEDLARGIALAAEHPAALHQTYFLANPEFYSWPEVGKMTAGILGRRTLAVRIPHWFLYGVAAVAQTVASIQRKAATLNIEKARDITQRYWICDTTKARTEIGFRNEFSLESGFRQTVKWYREQGWI
jgi:dihydroflavonol-4-reductase